MTRISCLVLYKFIIVTAQKMPLTFAVLNWNLPLFLSLSSRDEQMLVQSEKRVPQRCMSTTKLKGKI
jgi:hypothetical protein